jgi:hypothetical protein
MAARQEDVNSAMLSILKKMDTMVSATQETYEQSLITLGSVETIMRVDVGAELKKQTAVLMSIEAKLGAQEKGGGAGQGNLGEFKEAFGTIAEAMEKILKAAEKIDAKKADNIKNFFTKLGESINTFSKDVDAEKAKAAADLITAVSSGVLKYALVLAVAAPLLIIALPGAILFGLSIRLLMKSMGQVDMAQVEAMKAVLALAKGALLYSLAMVVVTALSPIVIIGSIALGLSIRLLLAITGTVDKDKIAGMEAVLALAKGALLYSLAMVAVTILAPVVLIGSIILALSIRMLAWGLNSLGDKQTRQGIRALAVLSIAIFAFALVLWAFPQMVDFKTAAFTFLIIGGFGILFYMLGKEATTIYKGGLAMLMVSFSVIVLALGLMIFKASKFDMMDALVLGLTITGLGVAMFIAGKFFKEIALGSIAMILAGTAVLILSLGLAIFKASKFQLEDALSLGAAITVVGLAFGIAGAGPIPGFIMLGSIAMMFAGVALIPLSLGLGAFKLMKFKVEDALSVGAAIGAVAASMSLAGLGFPLILLGSIAMTLASVALLPITGALALFKTIGWKKEDGENLQGALGSVISGFLGGPMPGGILESIKFAAQAAARAVLLFVTVPPMILAGLALLSISAGLTAFKKSGFTKADGEGLEFMIGSVAKAFTIITDKKRQKEMGVDFSPYDLMIGIMALSQAGNVLSSLAEGVKAWANLEVTEYEVINPGTKNAKLVIKAKRKLGKSDFENAAYGMAQVISAIAAPFAKVGKLDRGQSSGDPIYDAIFGGGFVSGGIDALARSGDTLVSLAKGVQAWANLEITEYEVVNAGTKNAKIVPKSIRKLGKGDFVAASTNIGTVVGFLANEFAKIGKMEANSEGIFSGGYISKGISMISGLGDNLIAVAESIQKMANMEIVENAIVDGKIVPKSVRKLGPTDFKNATQNIGMILGLLANAVADVGRMEANSEGWFSDGYVTKGMSAIGGLGQNVSAVADAVMKLANAEVTEYVVQDGKLIPKSTRKLNAGDFVKAGDNIDKILGILIYGIAKAGKTVEANQDAFDLAMDAIPNMSKTLADMAKPIEEWSKLKDVEKIGQSMTNFLTQIQSNFDPTKNKEVVNQDKYFTSFVKNIETMSDRTNSMTKMAENFDKIQKSMKLTKDSINAMDLKKLTLTDSLMTSLAAIAKNPEAMAKAVQGGINEAFEQLAKALEELGNKQSAGLQNVADNMPQPEKGPDGKPVVPTGPDAKTKAEMNKNKALGENNMQKDFIAALTAYGAAKQSGR